MQSGYTIAVALHVVFAVLGTGQVAAIAILSSTARRSGTELPRAAAWLAPLVRHARVGLAAMVITGVWMDLASGGVYHQMWWVRISGILIIVTFVLQRRAMSALGRVREGEPDVADAYARMERSAWSMCAAIGVITLLMAVKPF